MKRVLCSFVIAVVASSTPALAGNPSKTPAASATEKERAKAHFARGRELSDARQFAAAYDEFAAGYALTPRPLFLFNMAECQRALKNADKARNLYEQYVAAEPNGSFSATAKSRIAELTPRAAPAPTVAPAPVVAPPPAATAAPAPSVASIEPTYAEPTSATSVTGTRDLGAPRDTSSPPIYKRPVFWIGVGVAVAGGIAITYAATRSNESCTGTCLDLR